MGPSGFEPESDGPQPPSIGQANPRARVFLFTVVEHALNGGNLLDEVEVSNVHASAAVALQTRLHQGLAAGSMPPSTIRVEFFPDLWATTDPQLKHRTGIIISTHLIGTTSASCGERHGRVGAWAPCGVGRSPEAERSKRRILVSQVLRVLAFRATVVVDKTTGDGGTDGVGLTHDATTVGGDHVDVDLAQAVHGVSDDQGAPWTCGGSQRGLQDFNGFELLTRTRPLPGLTVARAIAVFRFPEDSTDFFFVAITGHLPSIGERVLPGLR